MLLRSIPRISSITGPLIFVILITSFITLHSLHELQLRIDSVLQRDTIVSETTVAEVKDERRVVWIGGHGMNIESTYMQHIFEAFRSFGYKIVTGCSPPPHWDVLWLHEYALSKSGGGCYYEHTLTAKWPQTINHIPGSGYYSSKVYLATANLSLGVPLAFKLPSQSEELLKYAKENQDVLWVQKDNSHRNIRIKSIESIDMTQKNSFVQQFIDNPLLIDNRKFDIGVYTVVTSLNPLRVYTFQDILIRFCPKDYNPFDINDVDKYVVGDDYTPIWEIPSLIDSYENKRYSMQESINSYLRTKGKDGNLIWKQLDKVIAEVFQSHQEKMLNSRKWSETDPKLFELSRFDFIVDEDLNVYLMEANMSPNLSSGHFKPNKLIYEQVLMSILSLVGLASPLTIQAEDEYRSRPRSEFAPVSDRDLATDFDFCGSCQNCQSDEKCSLCGECLTEDIELTDTLGETMREHLERRKMKRLHMEWTVKKPLARLDRLLSIWLKAKCQIDKSWC